MCTDATCCSTSSPSRRSRLSTIIDELLLASSLASRLDARRLPVDGEGFDPDEVARAVVQAARVHAPPGIEIELLTPPWLPDATGDAQKVAQVLANLVENAVKYSPAGGRIDVVLAHNGDRVRFLVRDQGLGIPLDEQERIFKKFYRLDPNLTRGIGGTGLGLYISHELVRRMGGEITSTRRPVTARRSRSTSRSRAPSDRVAAARRLG